MNEENRTTNIGLAIWRRKCFYKISMQGSKTVMLLNFSVIFGWHEPNALPVINTTGVISYAKMSALTGMQYCNINLLILHFKIKRINGQKNQYSQAFMLFAGTFLIISGILLLFFPAAAQALFDLPDISVLKESTAFAMGVRQFAIGLTIISLSLTKQIKALAYLMLIGTIIPLADFIIFKPVIGTLSALRHFATVPFIFGLGIYLLTKNNKINLDVNKKQ